MAILSLVSCIVNKEATLNESIKNEVSMQILNKYGNVIELNRETPLLSSLIFTDKQGHWKLINLQKSYKSQIKINKQPHYAGDSIVVETEDELKTINSTKANDIGDSSLVFKYKYPDVIEKFYYKGKVENFKNEKFNLQYLKIIQEIIQEKKL